jgi:hypothetical protein
MVEMFLDDGALDGLKHPYYPHQNLSDLRIWDFSGVG